MRAVQPSQDQTALSPLPPLLLLAHSGACNPADPWAGVRSLPVPAKQTPQLSSLKCASRLRTSGSTGCSGLRAGPLWAGQLWAGPLWAGSAVSGVTVSGGQL